MKIILKSLLITLLAIATFSLTACSIGVGGLQRYLDSGDGYQFLYPNGWVPVDVKNALENRESINNEKEHLIP